MAESEKNLGTLNSTLERLVSEVAGLRSELADLKRINTGVLQKHLVRKSSHKETHYLWFDKCQQQVNDVDIWSWPMSNCSVPNNECYHGHTNMLSLYQSSDWPYEVGDIQDFDPSSKHKHTNNLYFLEPQYTFSPDWANFIENSMPPEVQCWIRDRKMALVLWFPQEGFNMNYGANGQSWMQLFHEQLRKHQMEEAICYFVYGDLNIEQNYNSWLRTRQGMERTQFQFQKVIPNNFFHDNYWVEYSGRTAVEVHRLQNPKYMKQTHYGDSKMSGGYTDNVYIPHEDFDESLLNSRQDVQAEWQIRDSFKRCKPDEILVGIPNGNEKDKDLICLNARPRSHRPVLVSELFRIGYDNENSYISFLGREDMPNQVGTQPNDPLWKQNFYRNLDITGFVARKEANNIMFLSHDVQREWAYKFWLHQSEILADKPVNDINIDDRLMTVEMYKRSFFSLVSETLFADDNDSLFITEKIFKPIAYRHPFMVVGSYGTLRLLRSMGYETFPELFDESYDEEYDYRKRFSAILRNLEQWRQLNHDEKVSKYNAVREKLKHNFENFKNSRGAHEREKISVLTQLSSRGVDIH